MGCGMTNRIRTLEECIDEFAQQLGDEGYVFVDQTSDTDYLEIDVPVFTQKLYDFIRDLIGLDPKGIS